MEIKSTNYDQYAEIYDFQYIDYPANQGDIDFYKKIAVGKPDILDLGCGTGRIAVELVKTGHFVTGVDLSPAMLRKAIEKKHNLPAKVQSNLTLINSSMTSVILNKQFDLIYIGFRSFMLLLNKKDQLNTLLNIITHLKSNGECVISLFVPTLERLLKYVTHGEEFTYVREFTHPNLNDKIVEYERKYIDEYNQVAVHLLKHKTFGKNGIQIGNEEYRDLVFRWTYKTELEYLLQIAGFKILNVYGDYLFNPFTAGSKEMVWVLSK